MTSYVLFYQSRDLFDRIYVVHFTYSSNVLAPLLDIKYFSRNYVQWFYFGGLSNSPSIRCTGLVFAVYVRIGRIRFPYICLEILCRLNKLILMLFLLLYVSLLMSPYLEVSFMIPSSTISLYPIGVLEVVMHFLLAADIFITFYSHPVLFYIPIISTITQRSE